MIAELRKQSLPSLTSFFLLVSISLFASFFHSTPSLMGSVMNVVSFKSIFKFLPFLPVSRKMENKWSFALEEVHSRPQGFPVALVRVEQDFFGEENVALHLSAFLKETIEWCLLPMITAAPVRLLFPHIHQHYSAPCT